MEFHHETGKTLLEPLKPGDCIDIIAPASRCDEKDLEKIKSFLATWELQCRIPTDLFGDDLFSANTDAIRWKHLSEAITNTSSKAIWCLRGGYGAMKLIPALMEMPKPTKPKIFMGSSDITALHIFFQRHWGWTTLHAPSAQTASVNDVAQESLSHLKTLCFGTQPTITLEGITPLNSLAKKNLLISAPIIGGNLCLIQASLATSWQIDAREKILFIEEINERAYRIDRMLEQLKQATIIQSAKAILLGDFIGGKEPDGSSLIQSTLQKFADACPIPVLQIQGVGHGFVNHPIVLGYPVLLEKNQLKIRIPLIHFS